MKFWIILSKSVIPVLIVCILDYYLVEEIEYCCWNYWGIIIGYTNAVISGGDF